MLGSVGSARSFARAQLGALLGLSSCIDSGLATRDLALLCLELRSAYLDRRLARLISAKLIRLAIIIFLNKGNNTQTKKVRDKNGQNSKLIVEKPRTKKVT